MRRKYLNNHKFNESITLNQVIADIIRKSTMEYMKRMLNALISMDDKVNPKEINKCE